MIRAYHVPVGGLFLYRRWLVERLPCYNLSVSVLFRQVCPGRPPGLEPLVLQSVGVGELVEPIDMAVPYSGGET